MANTLKELIQKARSERKWLYVHYQSLWFSPDELQQANKEGRFNWNTENFVLRDPFELIKELEQKKMDLEIEIQRLYVRMK